MHIIILSLSFLDEERGARLCFPTPCSRQYVMEPKSAKSSLEARIGKLDTGNAVMGRESGN